jgi:putative transposase
MREAQYRNIEMHGINIDDSYGIEGKFLISIQADENFILRKENSELTTAGRIAEKYWKQIPQHFNSIELHEYLITEDCFYGIITVDISGKKVGEKAIYYNVVSQFEIAFSLMVGKKNPFLVEGSVFHVMTWFKAASLLEIMRHGSSDFKWKSGYFDFCIPDEHLEKEVMEIMSIRK